MSLRVDDFKAKLKGGGARPNLFRATVNFPIYAGGDVELTSFMCKAAQLPASIMNVIEVPFRGRQLKIAGDRTFEVWSPTVINDTGFEVRNALERWMNGMNGHSANTGITNPVAYQADLLVEQLDKDGSVLKTYKFRGCFPTNLSAIELSYDTVDTLEEFTVEFQVQYWEADTTS
jgi:hypothetical protein|tara:strand:- start:410 stop:934 length:525 start_codon:yes stop_codon:yes gene_type:complete